MWVAVEPGFEHIGEQYAAQSRIDRCMEGGKRFAHGDPLERLPPAQQFAVDLADRFEDLAGPMVVGQVLGRLTWTPAARNPFVAASPGG